MGRPKANIDWHKVDNLLKAQCDGVGIAGILGVSPDTLYRACQEEHNIGFAEYSAQKKSEGKELLRGKQFQMAVEGDKTMLVWLGKQYLDQRDKSDNHNENTDTSRIVVENEEQAQKIKDIIDGRPKTE
jgi:hypothetical protein